MKEPALLPQAWRLVRRELRGGLRGFGVFLACLFLGVFAIAAIGSFSAAARSGLLADAGALLGGDLEIRLAHRPLTSEQADFLAAQGRRSAIIETRTMAATAGGEHRTLVELKGVDEHYPLYGEVKLSPDLPLATALAGDQGEFGAIAEEALLQRLEIAVGDRIRLGEATLRITAVLLSEPDRAVQPFTLGPRLLIGLEALEATALVQPGSLVSYAYRLRLPQREQAESLMEELRSTFPEAGWRLRSWREAAPRVRFFIDRLSLNLTLLGLCALLVGGLGVSGAVRGYLAGKLVHIAAMKCLGATGRAIFTTYLLQTLLLGAAGTAAGLVGGALLPFAAARLIGERLPIPLAPALFPGVLATAALFGLLIALLFTLHPLGVARRVPPAVLFRGYAQGKGSGPGLTVWLGIVCTAALLALLAVATSDDRRLALWFLAGAGACFALFHLLGILLIHLARRTPRPADPRLRLGLGNLHRRGSPAASALFSLGRGLTALVIIAEVQANLQDRVNETVPQEAPAFFFLDIQPGQVEAFEATVNSQPQIRRLERFPTLRGRITAIAGVPVEEAVIDPEVQWAIRGDRFLSYAARPPAEARITAGTWWPADYAGPPLVSVTADVAKGFGVDIGDTLTVNVLGREITAEIANLRQVDWSTLELNFALLFSPGVLENAPQTHIATVHLPPAGEEALFREVTGRFPNISAISTREVLANVSRTICRLGGAFQAMAAVALLTGFLVLAGALSADQHRRIADAVIFKICGATRTDVLLAFAFEFAILGLAAGVLSALVGSLAAFGVVAGLMQAPFALHPPVVLLTVGAGLGLSLFLGLLGTWKALGHKPAPFLRVD